MKRRFSNLLVAAAVLLTLNCAFAAEKKYLGKKVLFVNSYHKGYEWSDGEQQSAQDILVSQGVEFEAIYMDTKNNSTEEFKKQAGLRVKEYIDSFKPDVVITSDDNAFQYAIMPYYRDSGLPVVFCGINWDVSIYGAPYKNTTGIIEAGLIGQLYNQLRKYAKGDKLGVISLDVPDERKNTRFFDRHIPASKISNIFVKDFQSWKDAFLRLQNSVDMIVFASPEGISGWNRQEAVHFVYEHIRVPTGTGAVAMTPPALIGVIKLPHEQGEYAARTALRILDGEKPADIPIAFSKKGGLYVSLDLAGKLDIVLPPSMLRNAKVIIGLE